MTVDLNIPYSSCELKRVKRLEFGVIHPDIVKKISVCEIVNVDLYKDGLPREGGLNDIRMGTIDYKLLCGTCNMNVKLCPGHFGHIVLAKPMYHYGFMNYVVNVLRCVCFHCGRLLCDRNSTKVKRIEKIKSGKIRLSKLAEICTSIKVCDHSLPGGEDSLNINDTSLGNFYNSDLSNANFNQQIVLQSNENTSNNSVFDLSNKEDVDCGCIQPKYTREGPNMYIQFVHGNEEYGDDSRRKLSAEEALEILKKIRKEEMGILGFDSDRCLPTSLIMTVLAIPPPCARPYVQYGNQRSEDDLTLKLLDIVKTNIQLKRQTERGARLHVIQDLCSLLQFHITTLLDNDIPGMPVATTRGKKPIKAIRTRLKGKEGRLRGNLMGKRVDFSARTVITGDPNLGIDYIGVPKSVAMTLTFCETVTPLNIEDLKKCVERGPYEWPGAKYIIRDNGAKYDLRHVRKNSEKELEYGYKVERHMKDDDYILFNRQPSLHKMSIMGHKAKILPYSTFRLNLSVTSPYNADFDGDEMNLHLAQSHETRSEVKHLMIVQKQIVSPQGNKPVMGIVQDSLLAIRKFTRRDNFLTKEEVMSLLIWIPYWNHQMPVPAIMKPKELWTGKQLFSMLLQFENSELDRTEKFIDGEDDDEDDDWDDAEEEEREMKQKKRLASDKTKGGVGASGGIGATGASSNSNIFSPQLYGNGSLHQLSSPLSISDGMLSPSDVVSTEEEAVKRKELLEIRRRKRLRRKKRIRSKLVKINLIRDSSTPCKDDSPYCSANDGKVIIKNNELLSGIICKRTVGSSSGSLIHILWHELGPDKTKEFISALQKLTNNWLENVGFTVSCSDIIASDKILNKVRDILDKSKKEVAKLVKKAQSGELECQPGKSLYESFETRVNNELNCAREMSGKASSESLDERNNIYCMVVSGSKGSVINISQIISCVGQQNVEGKRIPFGFNQRTLPHFIKFDYGPESRGFVSNSYLSGLSPQEVFFHAMGGREGIIDTACKTSETGYIQRRLIKAMEDVMVQYDRTVRNSYGEIIQFLYGEDGIAGEYIEDQIIDLMKLDNKEMARLYKYNFDDEEDYETDLFLCKNDDDEKNVYIDYNKQNILNQEFEELKRCKNYLCKELFPDGDIRQHLPINMSRLIEFAKTQFPYIPTADKLGETTAVRRVKTKGKKKKTKGKGKGKGKERNKEAATNIEVDKNIEFLSGIDEIDEHALCLSADENDPTNMSKGKKEEGEEGNNSEGDTTEDDEKDNEEEGDDEYYLEVDNKIKPFGDGMRRRSSKNDNGLLDPVEIVKKINTFLDNLVIIKQINSNDTLSLEAQKNATTLLKAHLRTYLNSKLLTRTYKISAKGIDWLLEEIEHNFYKSLCHPGECVGALAAQSIGEPATQMTLNTFHFAGVGSKNVTLGVPRLKELINVVKNVKTPSTTIYLDSLVSNDQQKAKDILTKLEYATLKQLTSHAQVIYDPYTTTTILEEDRNWVNEFYEFPDEEDTQYTLGEWVLRIKLTNIQVNEKKLTMKEIVYIIYTFFSRDELDIIYTDDNSEDLILRIRLKHLGGEDNSLNGDIMEEKEIVDNDDGLENGYNNYDNAFSRKTSGSEINFEENSVNEINGTMPLGREKDMFYKKDKNINNISDEMSREREEFPGNVTINRTLGDHMDRKNENKGKGAFSMDQDVDNINELFGGDDGEEKNGDLTYGIGGKGTVDGNRSSVNGDGRGGFNSGGINEHMDTMANNMFADLDNYSRHEHNEDEKMRSFGEDEKNRFHNNGEDSHMDEETTMQNKMRNMNRAAVPREDTEDMFLRKLMEQCLATLKLRGIDNITKVYMREEPKIHYDTESGKFVRSSQWVLDTDGCNLQEIFCAALVDFKKTISNDIVEIFEVLGIEAVRRALLKELRTVISFDSSYVNYRHLSILCDIMTQRGSLMPITRHGINRADRGPLLKCSFEETVDILLEAAAFAEVDYLKGVTENIMLGQMCRIGTGSFDIIIDSDKLIDANQNLEIIQDITSAGFTTPDTFQGITPEGLQSPIPVNTINSPLPFSPTYNLNLLSPTAPLDASGSGINSNSAISASLVLSPQSQKFTDSILSPTKNDFNNLDTSKLGGKFSPVQSPHSPQSPTSVIHSPFSPFDMKNQMPGDRNAAYSPSGNYMNNIFSPKGNSNANGNVQSPGVYSPNYIADIFSPNRQTVKNNIYSPSYSPTSPSYNVDNVFYSPTSPQNNLSDKPNVSSGANVMSPRYSPTSPKYSPTSPKYSPTSPQYSPTSPVAKNITSPQYSPYSVCSPKFSPTSPAYSITSSVYDKGQTSFSNRPLSPAYILHSPTQEGNNAQTSGMYSPAMNISEDVQKDDPFSPTPYNIEEDAEEEEEEEDVEEDEGRKEKDKKKKKRY